MDSEFNYQRDSVGIQWNVLGADGGSGAGVDTAFLSFDEGMYPRCVDGLGCVDSGCGERG